MRTSSERAEAHDIQTAEHLSARKTSDSVGLKPGRRREDVHQEEHVYNPMYLAEWPQSFVPQHTARDGHEEREDRP